MVNIFCNKNFFYILEQTLLERSFKGGLMCHFFLNQVGFAIKLRVAALKFGIAVAFMEKNKGAS